MSTHDGDSDHTVFRSDAGDRTVLRPTPGRRSSAAPRPAPAPAAVADPPPAAPRPAARTRPADFQGIRGLNPLVGAASALLAILGNVRATAAHPNPAGLYQRLAQELKTFELRAREQDVRAEIVLAARYVLCSALDEAVLNTPWGSESPWMQRTLLSAFHNENTGGEKFFVILDRMRQSPAENRDMLELQYLILSLGFEGRYRLMANGRDQLEALREELFRTLRTYRGEYERELSARWQGVGRTRSTLSDYVPMWVVASVVAAFLLVSYLGFRVWLYQSSEPVHARLLEVERPAAVAERPVRLGARDELEDAAR